MIGTIKKLGLFGIGAWALTEEKINEITKELIDKGEIDKEEGKKFVLELIEEQKKQKEEIENRISKTVKETFGKVKAETKEDIERLEMRINKLEEEIKKLSE